MKRILSLTLACLLLLAGCAGPGGTAQSAPPPDAGGSGRSQPAPGSGTEPPQDQPLPAGGEEPTQPSAADPQPVQPEDQPEPSGTAQPQAPAAPSAGTAQPQSPAMPSSGSARPVQEKPAPVRASRTLAQPVYPKFPACPEEPKPGESWDNYFQAQEDYYNTLRALRGTGLQEAAHAHLNDFAGRSTALALEGREGENVVYSPLSLWSALAMLAQCAQGDSRQQVLDALGAANTEVLQEEVSQVWRGLYTDDGASSLILANSIWLNSALQGAYVQDTLDTLAQRYYAGAYAVPMGTEEADQKVSDWVKEQTNGLIGGDQPVVRTKAETLALLASSLYYRAGWTDEFQAHLTQEDTFTDAAGRESQVDFMHKTQQAHFLRREGYQAAKLDTRLGEMVFVLPDEGVSPESLLQEPEFLSRLEFYGDAAVWGEVRWSVPKFDVDSDLGLLDLLTALGVSDLLDPDRADLSALTGLSAYVSDAKQLARVNVDEEGVEAAAVTIITMDCTSVMPPMDPEVCVMDLDRPFLFVIRSEGVPLFIGVVNQV